MAMFNTPPAWAEGISTRWGHAFCTRLTGIRSTHKAAPNDEIGCGISVSNQGPISIGKPFLGAALVFMRANGNGTWTIDWPNYRMTRPLTFEEGGGADPVQVYPGGLSGPLYSGNDNSTLSAFRVPMTLYQCALWGRALSDTEVREQYQRCCLRFPGVLL